MQCSCCKGALTFDEARFVKEKLTSGRAVPNTKPRKFEGVPATACWGIENYKELFGLGSDKEALSAAFEAGTDDTKGNLLFGSSGIVSRTLDHWRELLDDAFKLIESLRAELFKSRAEAQKALGEKEKAESECIHAKLKLDQMQVRLDSAQDALHAGAQDRRVREVQGAFGQADQEYRVRMAKAAITASLLSRLPGKNWMDRLKARKTPLHQTGLTRSPSRVVNRAPGVHALRSAGRGIEATDSGALHRSTAMRRRDKTLPLLNEFVARAGPVHLPSVACPPESDTKAHNDYKAQVRARSRARAIASSPGGSAGDPRERRQLLEGWDAAHPQGAHRPHRPLLLGLRCRHAPAPQGGAVPPQVDVREDHGGGDAASHGRDDPQLGGVS